MQNDLLQLIMKVSKRQKQALTFKQEQTTSIPDQQSLQEKVNKSPHNQTMQTGPSSLHSQQPNSQKSPRKEVYTSIIEVKPMPEQKTNHIKPQQEGVDQNLLYVSQTSEKNQIELVREEEKTRFHHQNYNEYEAEEEEGGYFSPQSSLRKLYKASKHAPVSTVYDAEPPQKLLNEDISQSRIMDEEQEDSDYEEEIEQVTNKKQLRSNNLQDLILFPVPDTKMIRCLVMVTNNKFFSLQNIFDLYLVQQKRHLLRAVKKRFRIFSTFEIQGKGSQNSDPIAVSKSNFTRTQYKLMKFQKSYAMSQRISENSSSAVFQSDLIKVEAISCKQSISTTENEICYIGYESNILGLSQQKVSLIKPKKIVPKTNRFSDLKCTYQNCEYERIRKFTTRMAEKNSEGNLVLDFKEKNISNSSRNMIIESQFGEAGIMFAKFSDEIYILNVMSPFNLLEAFFLALCNLDRKPLVS